jgi:hypothetical protein
VVGGACIRRSLLARGGAIPSPLGAHIRASHRTRSPVQQVPRFNSGAQGCDGSPTSALGGVIVGGMTLAHRLPHSSVVARSNAQSSTELDACATRRDLQLGHPLGVDCHRGRGLRLRPKYLTCDIRGAAPVGATGRPPARRRWTSPRTVTHGWFVDRHVPQLPPGPPSRGRLSHRPTRTGTRCRGVHG